MTVALDRTLLPTATIIHTYIIIMGTDLKSEMVWSIWPTWIWFLFFKVYFCL